MGGQIPEGSEGVAVASITFAAISLICSSAIIWLTFVHNERLSYVALLAYFALVSTIASVIQQIHVVAFYQDVAIEQFEDKLKNPTSPDSRLANGSVGMDLILYYIQFYCYQVMSLLILWWASELAQSVYGLVQKRSTRKILRKVNAAGKITAVIIPIIIILLLRSPPVQQSQLTFTVITDIPLGMSMGVGSILMLMILGRYIYSRRRLLRFDAGQGASTDPESQTSSSAAGSRYSRFTKIRRKRAIYDRWLMTRFTVAFFFLCIFQATATLFQQLSIGNFEAYLALSEPDLSAGTARKTFLLFIPGNLPGVGMFLVFGTTATFRKYMFDKWSSAVNWIKAPKRTSRKREMDFSATYSDLPSPRMGYHPHIYSTAPNLMKDLPHRPGSRTDGYEDVEMELQQAEKAIVHDRNTIYVMRTLSVRSSSRPNVKRMPTDSSQDSTPSLLIMRQSTEERR